MPDKERGASHDVPGARRTIQGGCIDAEASVKRGAGMRETEVTRRVREILKKVKTLAAEYYELTEKPLGVTGEVAEYLAAEALGLKLVRARTPGYDAIRKRRGREQRIQIKARVYGDDAESGQRLRTIKRGSPCDFVLFVRLNRTLDLREIWEAPMTAVDKRFAVPGSKARARGALGVKEFKKHCLARQVWPEAARKS